MSYAVVASRVWKMLGSKWILRDVNITVPKGAMALIVGPNGSGKSTFLKMVSGLWRPTRGSIRVFGRDPAAPPSKKFIGVVLHENLLYEELTVEENLRFYSRFHGVDAGYFREIIEILGLSKVWRLRVGELSFGWKRRANIARAMLHSPKLLVIDEPLTGLDPAGREAVLEIIKMIVSRGGAVLAASPTPEPLLTENVGVEVFRIDKGTLRRYEP